MPAAVVIVVSLVTNNDCGQKHLFDSDHSVIFDRHQ